MFSFLNDVRKIDSEVPQKKHFDAYEELLAKTEEEKVEVEGGEEWNTSFGDDSLYSAFVKSSIVKGVHAANAERIISFAKERDGKLNVLEVGGGEGSLWRKVQEGVHLSGNYTLIDPFEQTHGILEQIIGSEEMEFWSMVVGAEKVTEEHLEDKQFDVIVISLTLHHCPGESSEHLARHGMEGNGKKEILRLLGKHLHPEGMMLVNEADIYCDVSLATNSAALKHNVIGSYVRRAAKSIIFDIQEKMGGRTVGELAMEGDEGVLLDALDEEDRALVLRWGTIVRKWCVGQIQVTQLEQEKRDVFELDVGRWLELFVDAGLVVDDYQYTDDFNLFVQYIVKRGE